MRKVALVVAGALALAAPAPAQATPGLAPGQPAGPCSQNQTTAQAVQACQACRAKLYPPPNQPPPTPYEVVEIDWNCGSPGATDPAKAQDLQGAPGYQQP